MGNLQPVMNFGETELIGYNHYCPGCNFLHFIPTKVYSEHGNPTWTFNGDLQRPTFTPSVRVFHSARPEEGIAERTLCHYFITDGRIEYCGDCEHHLNGQTVLLQPRDEFFEEKESKMDLNKLKAGTNLTPPNDPIDEAKLKELQAAQDKAKESQANADANKPAPTLEERAESDTKSGDEVGAVDTKPLNDETAAQLLNQVDEGDIARARVIEAGQVAVAESNDLRAVDVNPRADAIVQTAANELGNAAKNDAMGVVESYAGASNLGETNADILGLEAGGVMFSCYPLEKFQIGDTWKFTNSQLTLDSAGAEQLENYLNDPNTDPRTKAIVKKIDPLAAEAYLATLPPQATKVHDSVDEVHARGTQIGREEIGR